MTGRRFSSSTEGGSVEFDEELSDDLGGIVGRKLILTFGGHLGSYVPHRANAIYQDVAQCHACRKLGLQFNEAIEDATSSQDDTDPDDPNDSNTTGSSSTLRELGGLKETLEWR